MTLSSRPFTRNTLTGQQTNVATYDALGLRLVSVLAHNLLERQLNSHGLRAQTLMITVRISCGGMEGGYLGEDVQVTHDDLIKVSVSEEVGRLHHAVLKTCPDPIR